MISEANDIIEELDKAIKISLEGRKGPVWIDVPLDIQSAQIDFEESLIDKKIDFKKPVNPNQILFSLQFFVHNAKLLFY